MNGGSDIENAGGVIAADVDGDGNLDIVGSSYLKIGWYRNLDGRGTFGPQQIISSTIGGSIHPADLDNDGDLDILFNISSSDGLKFAWYENLDGLGNFGPERVILGIQPTDPSAGFASDVLSADFDGDGDLDVLLSFYLTYPNLFYSPGVFAWYENSDGQGTFVSRRILSDRAVLDSINAADIDGDGDQDIVFISFVDGIFWMENGDGRGTFRAARKIFHYQDLADSLHTADIDADGDLDIIFNTLGDGAIWIENLDGHGAFGSGSAHYINSNSFVINGQSVDTADLDQDGDIDVLSTQDDPLVAWWENQDGSGTFGSPRALSQPGAANGVAYVTAADVDRDRDIDVLWASNLEDKISWRRNLLLPVPTRPIVRVAATDNRATEAGSTTGAFRFTRTGSTASELTINYALGGTATPDGDYAALGVDARFPAGVASVTKTLTPTQDTLQESNETVVLKLVAGPDYAVGTPNHAIITLTSDDPITRNVSVAASDNTTTEAGLTTGAFRFTRTGNTSAPLTVRYRVAGTAIAGGDYVWLNTAVRFPAGAASVTKTVTPKQDTLMELPETVILTLEQNPEYAVGEQSNAVVTLTSDEEVARIVSVAAPDNRATEAGLTTSTFQFTRNGDTTAALAVRYSVTGTATGGSDYVPLGTSVVFQAGATQVTKTLTALQDSLAESDESVILTLLQNPNYAIAATNSATATIVSDER